jgi:hypothetical protein
VIHDFSVKISPQILSQNLEYYTQILDLIHDEAMRVRIKPNDDVHSRLIAVLVSIESTMAHIQSAYAVCVL